MFIKAISEILFQNNIWNNLLLLVVYCVMLFVIDLAKYCQRPKDVPSTPFKMHWTYFYNLIIHILPMLHAVIWSIVVFSKTFMFSTQEHSCFIHMQCYIVREHFISSYQDQSLFGWKCLWVYYCSIYCSLKYSPRTV